MSRNYAQFREQKLANMDLSTSKLFKSFGYGWNDHLETRVGPSELMDRLSAEVTEYYHQGLVNEVDPFTVVLPKSVHDDAKLEVVSAVSTGMGYMPTKNDMQRLYERFGYRHSFKITSKKDVDMLIESEFVEEDFGVGTISVANMKLMTLPVMVIEAPILPSIPLEVESAFNTVGEQFVRTCSPFFFHYEGHSLRFDDYVADDNFLLKQLSEEFNVELFMFISYRSVGRSLLDTFTLLRIELDEKWFQVVVKRDKDFAEMGISRIASKIGISVRSLVAGVYARATLGSVSRSYTETHPFWLLLGGSRYVGLLTWFAIELEEFFFLHRVLEKGYLEFDTTEKVTDWILHGEILSGCGFSIVPGGIAVTGINCPPIVGKSPDFVHIRVVKPSALWGRMMDYIIAMCAGGRDAIDELYPVFCIEFHKLGFNPKMTLDEAWFTLNEPHFQEFVYYTWFQKGKPNFTTVTHRFTSRNLPQVGGYNFGEYDQVWYLSVKFGGVLPHDCVRRIFYFLPSYIDVTTTSYSTLRGSVSYGAPYLKDLGNLLGRGYYPYSKERCALPQFPVGNILEFTNALDVCCSMRYKGHLWDREFDVGRFYAKPLGKCKDNCLCWHCRVTSGPIDVFGQVET